MKSEDTSVSSFHTVEKGAVKKPRGRTKTVQVMIIGE